MTWIWNIGRMTLIASLGVLMIGAVLAPGLLAQGPSQIEGTVTGMNTTEDPPILAITTDGGPSYLLRAPNFSSVAGVQVGSRFRATGSVVGNAFIASSIQLADAGDALPPQPIVGGLSGTITGADTSSDPPRLLVDTGSGSPRLLMLPGPERMSDIQLGAVISFDGSPRADAFQVSEWLILSYPSADDSGDDNDNS